MAKELFRGFSPQVMEARCQGRMMERRVRIVADFLSGQKNLESAPVLEIGAGTGKTMSLVARTFPKVRFLAVEPVGEYVRYAQEKYAPGDSRLVYREGTVEALGLADKSVAAAYSINIWHHIDKNQLRDAAKSVARVLKDGGRLLLIEPNFRHPYIYCYQGLTKGERHFAPWRELAALRGFFDVEKVSFQFFFPEFVRSLPPWLMPVESVLEHVPFLAGSVVYTLKKR